MMEDNPNRYMVMGADGLPRAVVDLAQVQSHATRLMYQMAAAADDDDRLDRIGIEWADALDPDFFGYVAAGALSLTARNVLRPLLEVLDTLAPELGVSLRDKLRESRDFAEQTLGGGR